jgi:NDP-sugar pyrophosphorylase family protein
MSRHVRAVVLAGGEGRRLRPYTTIIPKPLMPLGERAILEILLLQLAAQGFTRVDMCVGYLSHLIRAYFGDGERVGLEIVYHDERTPLGTIGALETIPDIAPDESLLVMNGDLLTDLHFGDVLARHNERGGDATICVTRRRVTDEFGVIDVGEDGTLAAYHEKPVHEVVVSIGVNVVTGASLAAIRPGERIDVPDFMLRLKEQGRTVFCHEIDAFWLDLGRVDDYRVAAEMVEEDPSRFLPA